MKARVDLPDPAILHDLYTYDPAGFLRWKVGRGGMLAGSVCGVQRADGYKRIHCGDGRLLEHRIIWAMFNGAWPAGEVDHINGIRSDNRIENLRDINRSGNRQNLKRPHRNNTCGYLGVTRARRPVGTFMAKIMVDRVWHYLGSFPTAEQAGEAYIEAKRRLHPMGTL